MEGRLREPVGEYDWLIDLAIRHNWTPEQISRMDPDYLENLQIRHEEAQKLAARRERIEKLRRARAARRGRAYRDAEDVDLSEIV